jgi:hypothetical protein
VALLTAHSVFARRVVSAGGWDATLVHEARLGVPSVSPRVHALWIVWTRPLAAVRAPLVVLIDVARHHHDVVWVHAVWLSWPRCLSPATPVGKVCVHTSLLALYYLVEVWVEQHPSHPGSLEVVAATSLGEPGLVGAVLLVGRDEPAVFVGWACS